MFCQKCGAKMDDGAKFCNQCGADMQTGRPAPAVQTAAPVAAAAGKRSANPVLIAVIVILLLVIAGLGIYAVTHKGGGKNPVHPDNPGGFVQCPVCDGVGKMDYCTFCGSTGKLNNSIGEMMCGHCGGTGRMRCETCYGTGLVLANP